MKRVITIAVLIVGTLAIFGTLAIQSNFSTVQAQNQCAEDWWSSLDKKEQERCGKEKYDRQERDRKIVASQPYATTIPETPDPEIFGTPVPNGYIPSNIKQVEEVSKLDVYEIPTLRYADSVWKAGTVVDEAGGYAILYVWSATSKDGKHTRIGYYFLGNDPKLNKKYNRVWKAPKEVGQLIITDVSGSLVDNTPNVISFTTTSGQNGTFVPATEEWTFASST